MDECIDGALGIDVCQNNSALYQYIAAAMFCRAGVFPGAFVVVWTFIALGFTPAPIACVCRPVVSPVADGVRLSR